MSRWSAANQFRSRRPTGDKVVGGTINGTGSLVMKAERVGAETLLAQIVKMVSEAQRTRAPIQRLADQVASYFVPAVLAAAVITFAVWAIFGPQPRYAHALVNAVAVLIIACPCALGLGHAHVHHGGHWSRRRRGDLRPQCRSIRNDGEGQHVDRGQNRNSYRG